MRSITFSHSSSPRSPNLSPRLSVVMVAWRPRHESSFDRWRSLQTSGEHPGIFIPWTGPLASEGGTARQTQRKLNGLFRLTPSALEYFSAGRHKRRPLYHDSLLPHIRQIPNIIALVISTSGHSGVRVRIRVLALDFRAEYMCSKRVITRIQSDVTTQKEIIDLGFRAFSDLGKSLLFHTVKI